jgi:hypothetical protein
MGGGSIDLPEAPYLFYWLKLGFLGLEKDVKSLTVDFSLTL